MRLCQVNDAGDTQPNQTTLTAKTTSAAKVDILRRRQCLD